MKGFTMSPVIHLILLVLAGVLFGVATWGPANPSWNRLVSAGLTALVGSMISW